MDKMRQIEGAIISHIDLAMSRDQVFISLILF